MQIYKEFGINEGIFVKIIRFVIQTTEGRKNLEYIKWLFNDMLPSGEGEGGVLESVHMDNKLISGCVSHTPAPLKRGIYFLKYDNLYIFA